MGAHDLGYVTSAVPIGNCNSGRTEMQDLNARGALLFGAHILVGMLNLRWALF